MWNGLDKSCKGNQNTLFILIFFSENYTVFLYNVENHGRANQATDYNTAHALCVLDK